MSNSNKSAREMLERIYGKHCMIHEGIRKLRPPTPKKAKYKGKSIAEQLTYHHLKAKRYGGRATVDNGANVCRKCHDWLEQLSELEREKVNEELREYKRNFFTIGAIEITTDGIQQAKKLDFRETEEYISIPAYDITPEEYQKYIEQRRKRELNKPKWKGKEYEDR